MNTGAIILLVAVLAFVVIEVVALVRDILRKRKQKKEAQTQKSAEALLDSVENNNTGGIDDDRCTDNASDH